MAYDGIPKDKAEALEALERLLTRRAIEEEEARKAARLITGDPAFEFPPPSG